MPKRKKDTMQNQRGLFWWLLMEGLKFCCWTVSWSYVTTAGNTFWDVDSHLLECHHLNHLSLLITMKCLTSDTCAKFLSAQIINPTHEPVFYSWSRSNSDSPESVTACHFLLRDVKQEADDTKKKKRTTRKEAQWDPKLVPFTPRCYSVCGIHTPTESHI